VAICFIRANIISRSGGKSATAAAAYRSGEKIVDRATDKTHDYTKKEGINHSEILTPIAATDPNQWLTDRAELWNRVETTEKRSDAQLAREMIIAIPRELAQPDQIALIREYVQSSYVDRGMIADINLHHLDGDNPHAHVMLTMRELKIDEQGVVSFGNKDRSWNDKKLLETQIKEWSDITNQYLERAGYDTRIDSRSYEEQNIPRIPQIHLGKNVTAMRRQGIPTERGDLYDQIDRANEDIRQNLEKIYQAEGAIRDRGNAETTRPQREVNEPKSQEPSPDFERTRSDLESLTNRLQRNDSSQRERRNQPGADSRTNRENRTDRAQPNRDLGTDSNDRAASNLRPEDTQNRQYPNLDQTRPTEQTDSSNPDFAAIQAGFIELSNQTRDRRTDPERSSERKYPPSVNRIRNTTNRGSHNVVNSQHQEHPNRTDSTGTSINPTTSTSTERNRQSRSKTPAEKAAKIDINITNQLAYQQIYQAQIQSIKESIIAAFENDLYYSSEVKFGEFDLNLIDRIAQHQLEKIGHINPDKPKLIDNKSDHQREVEDRLLEKLSNDPSLIKIKDGLINLEFDIEDEMKNTRAYQTRKSEDTIIVAKNKKVSRDSDYGMSM
jgi:MobA/MobL family